MAKVPPGSTYLGPPGLPATKTAAIFNSRQSKYPLGSDPWIAATAAAVALAKDEGLTIITSLGMNTWELVLTLAVRSEIPVIIVWPRPGLLGETELNSVKMRFRLNSEITGFVVLGDAKIRSRKENWPSRDACIAEMADVLFPISIRAGGNLDLLLAEYPGKTDNRFRIPYRTAPRPRPRYDRFRCSDAVSAADLLIHFTRTASGRWPDESDYDFYQAVLASHSEYCRSARQTLRHILETGIIRASGRHIREGLKVVGFTDASKTDMSALFRYRPRLVNPYFEPYGIGVCRKHATELDIRPVTYAAPDTYELLEYVGRAYYQNAGGGGERWRKENEWRFVGDFCLGDFRSDFFRVIVPSTLEIEAFEDRTDISIVPLFENP